MVNAMNTSQWHYNTKSGQFQTATEQIETDKIVADLSKKGFDVKIVRGGIAVYDGDSVKLEKVKDVIAFE